MIRIAEVEKKRANVNSHTTALNTYLLNQFLYVFRATNSSDPKSIPPPTAETEDFLPFPEIAKKTEDDILEPKTKEILILLLKSRRIPEYVYSTLIDPPKSTPSRQ